MRKALKTVLCVALVLALAVVIALRVLPPMNAPAQSAAATPTPAAAAAVVPTPTPEPDNGLPKVNTGSWELTLVNAQNSIGEAVPEDLAELEGGRYFDARAVDALKDFIAGARAEGLSVCLSSAYRSYNEQTYLFNRKVSQCGGDEAAAARIVNRPGTSEHQLGLCADITDKFYEVKTKELEKTALYQWMYAHCQNYGFILRYPADKQDTTGIQAEPWHYRYVGQPHAAYMQENNVCLEEYLTLLKNYSADVPLSITNWDGEIYQVYYVAADTAADSTYVMVPPDKKYTISGNNSDGFIVTVDTGEIQSGEAAASEASGAADNHAADSAADSAADVSGETAPDAEADAAQ